MTSPLLLPALLLFAVAAPAMADEIPGAEDPARIEAGTYAVDPAHSQVAFAVDHMGFNVFRGLFAGTTGTLTLDPQRPGAASVVIEIPVAQVITTSPELDEHLRSSDFFDAEAHPTASFRSTAVAVDGTRARITGDLTVRGVTRPVELDARFTGAGVNPMHRTRTVGFEATASIRRSDFGVRYAVPSVADRVDLAISVAFEKPE